MNRKIVPGVEYGNDFADLYEDAQIGPLSWSTDENFLAFVAESSRPKAQAVTDYQQTTGKGADRLGSKYEHRFDLGEQYD